MNLVNSAAIKLKISGYMNDKTNDQNGMTYKALLLINERPFTPMGEFIRTFRNEYAHDDDLEKEVNNLINNNYCELREGSLIVTEQGRDYLSSLSPDEFKMEYEDTSSESPTRPYLVSKLKMEPKTLSVFQALRKIDRGEIDIDPEFQRAFVWDITKQSRLIESVLIRIPLPAFYLDATDQVRWSVVDGLQRLTTLHKFCRNEFKLTNLQFLTELEGLAFDKLPAVYRVLLEDDTSLQFYNLMPGTPAEAKYTIFSRVNTGGMQLTAQEIRHALNQGKITRWLRDVAHSDVFLKVTEGAVESKRMSDRELVLRTVSFMHFGIESYRQFGELDSFLLFAMEKFNSSDDFLLESLKNDFEESLLKVRSIFGKYAFRKFYSKHGRRSPLNKALFETWVKSVSDYSLEELMSKKEKIINLFIGSMSFDVEFLKSISSSTGSNKAVSERFSTVEKILKDAFND